LRPTAGHLHGFETKGYRSYVLTALLIVYIMNFIDRGLLSVVAPVMKPELGISDTAFGLLTGFGFAALSVGTSLVVGPKRYNRAKMEAYECGIQPTPRAEGGGRVPIKYFLTAMLFIIFDIESVFLYPFAVAFDQLGLFALIEMVLFIVTVFVAYAYVWKRGGLEWD